MVGLGLNFKTSGLDQDRKISQSAYLYCHASLCRTLMHAIVLYA